MKPLFLSIILILFLNSAMAQNMCNTPCSISISFPEGGSISTSEAMTISFGNNGVLDLGATGSVNTATQPASIDYSAGGELILAAGDSITFDDNGLLDSGDAGNFSSASVSISTSGDVSIIGGESIVLSGALTIGGQLNIDMNSLSLADQQLEINGLVVSSGVVLSGDPLLSGTGSITAVNGNISIDGIIFSSTDTLNIAEVMQLNSSINTNSGVLGMSSYDIQELLNSGVLEGVEINAKDGVSCTITGDECISADGTQYVLKEGEFVKLPDASAEGGGATGLISIFILLLFYTHTVRTHRHV